MSNYPDFCHPRYQIVRELGRNREGGRITYLATGETEKKMVALKQFRFAQADSNWEGYKTYQRELQLLQELDYPGIPRYVDAFETPEGFSLVQEYIPAPSLAERHSFKPDEIKHIAVSILEILRNLQNRLPPVIHRDLKPENILLDEQLNVYLVDFGLARIGSQDVAASSIAAGTPGFIAPEQLFNRPLSLATDLYSLGATLFCLLTGTRSADIGKLIDENYRFNFQLLDSRLNKSFVKWLKKMLSPVAQKRYPNAASALAALKPLEVMNSPANLTHWKLAGLVVALVSISLVGELDKLFQQPVSPELPPVVETDVDLAREFFQEGERLREQGADQRALIAYDEAIRLRPNYSEAFSSRCQVLQKMERYPEALTACDRALSINSSSKQTWNRQAGAFAGLGRNREAIATYTRALQLDPDYYWAWNDLGNIYNQEGRYAEALAAAQRATELDPYTYNAWKVRGEAELGLQRYPAALNSFASAIKINPEESWSWYGQGVALEKIGSNTDAIASYNQAIQLNPEFYLAIEKKRQLLAKSAP
ncbi:MAG: serine/threonine-protein kinase [Oscillatoria sp. PMC 1068.18]|nr:serine/threonine-protein kinase [Oscillatoria sp. PMC 1076.18]MEC4991007.1 serine/threonine-protein kinase [Oscillatoria sp. PMC 1068.18]